MKNYRFVDKSILRWFFIDYLSQPFSRKIIAVIFSFVGVLLFVVNKQRAISYLMTAQRFYPNAFFTLINKKIIPFLPDYYSVLMSNDIEISAAASRSIILKMPQMKDGKISKGIIDITFTDTNKFYYYNVDVKQLNKYFYIVLEPSWAGYCLPEILFWTLYQDPVFVQSTEITDRNFLAGIDRNLVSLDFGASDWVDYRKFYPIEFKEKLYDSLYVANYNPVKRLHVYFNALMIIKSRGINYKGAIVCASWGAHRDAALKLIDYYDVADILDVHESLNAGQINEIMSRSKCNILLSLKEGSNRSLFEAMFCNVPVIALKNNVGINKDYINSSTGLLVEESALVEGLLRMQSNYCDFVPRDWAKKNISPEVTMGKLLNAIKSVDSSFTVADEDVFNKTNDPEVSYFDKDTSPEKNYFMEKVLKIFDIKNSGRIKEEELFTLAEKFYSGHSSCEESVNN